MNEEEFGGFLKYSKEEYDAEIKANFDRIDAASSSDRDKQLQELDKRQAMLYASLNKDHSLTEEAREQAKAAAGNRIEIAKSEISESKMSGAEEEKKKVKISLQERYGQEDEPAQKRSLEEIRQQEIEEKRRRQIETLGQDLDRKFDRTDSGQDKGQDLAR